jgi:hypothetical protein
MGRAWNGRQIEGVEITVRALNDRLGKAEHIEIPPPYYS